MRVKSTTFTLNLSSLWRVTAGPTALAAAIYLVSAISWLFAYKLELEERWGQPHITKKEEWDINSIQERDLALINKIKRLRYEGLRTAWEESQLLERSRSKKMSGTDRYRGGEKHSLQHARTADSVDYSNSNVECWPRLILTS